MKRTIHFVVAGTRASVTLDVSTLNPVHTIFMTGEYDGSCGQSVMSMKEDGADRFEPVAALTVLWNKYHMKKTSKTALKAINKAMDALDGQRFGNAPDVSDAPELDSDIFDSRDAVRRMEIYREAIQAFGIDPTTTKPDDFDVSKPDGHEIRELLQEFAALANLESQVAGNSEWGFGMMFIRESYFRTYAESFAEDIGAIQSNASWPNNYIDWEAAAAALAQDYEEYTFKGETYFAR